MNHKIRLSGVLAWTALGLVMGFVVYSVLSLYSISGLAIALICGGFTSSLTILLYKEQESDSDKFFVSLCVLTLAALASAVNTFNYAVPGDLSISVLVVGILVGILVSMILVVYLIND